MWVQRKAPLGSFRNVKRIYLGANSRAVFSARLPKGRSILRLVLPDSQAGVGYVAEHEPPDPAHAVTRYAQRRAGPTTRAPLRTCRATSSQLTTFHQASR